MQFGAKRLGIVDEAEKHRQVQALVLRHVVYIDGTRLDEDRTEQIWSRELAAPAPETHADNLRPPERLCPTGHLHRVRGRQGDSPGLRVQTVGREHIDLDTASAEYVTKPEGRRRIQGETHAFQCLRNASGAVAVPGIGQGVRIEARPGHGQPTFCGVELHHAGADQRPAVNGRCEVQ